MNVNRRDFFKTLFGSAGLLAASKAQAAFGVTESVKVDGLEAHDGARLENVTIEGVPVNVVGKDVHITRCIFKNPGSHAIKVGR